MLVFNRVSLRLIVILTCNTHVHNETERESVSFALTAVFYFNALLQLIELDGGL